MFEGQVHFNEMGVASWGRRVWGISREFPSLDTRGARVALASSAAVGVVRGAMGRRASIS